MKIKPFLTLMGDMLLSSAEPEGRQIVEQINRYTANQYHYSAITAPEAIELIQSLPDTEREAVFNYELNDGLNLVEMRDDLQGMIEALRAAVRANPANNLRLVVTGFMAFLVFLMSFCFTGMVIYIGYQTRVFPPWEIMVLPFIIPGMVIWHVFGVLTKERRDLLMAALGKTPPASLMERMGDIIQEKTVPVKQPSGFDPSDPKSYR